MKNCGRLDKRITFCKQSDILPDNDDYRHEQQLVPIRTVWASVRPTTSTESFEQQRLYNSVTYDIRTRYLPSLLDTRLIILYRGERFEIRSAVDIGGKGEEIAFTCLSIDKGEQYTYV